MCRQPGHGEDTVGVDDEEQCTDHGPESPDLPEGTDILDVYLPQRSRLEVQNRPEFLGGMTTNRGDVLLRTDKREGMYHTLDKPAWQEVKAQFVPYYAWSNRGRSEMTVWLPVVWE